ncbi:MAG: ABC transporter permease [Dehalobacterium sp.]|jgi:NitT/TauT family transport system permease protein
MKKPLQYTIIGLIWLVIWQALSVFIGYEILLPGPWQVLKTLGVLTRDPLFWQSVISSMMRIILGFLLGLVLGCFLAVLTTVSSWCKAFFTPLMGVIKATPVASFIILALVWLATGHISVFTAFLIVLPVVWSNVFTGIAETDEKLLEMAHAFQVTRKNLFFKLYLPSVQPFFVAAITASMGMAWKAGIAAEVICNPPNSIGGALYDAKIYLDTPELFAWTGVVILLSVILEKILISFISSHKGGAGL